MKEMKMDIKFTCYHYNYDGGHCTLFLFYPDGTWDEDKLTIKEAIHKYPVDKYEWLHFD